MASAPSSERSFHEQPSTRQVEDLLHPHRKALTALMHSEALSRGDVAGALELVTEVASRILNVERASVWRFSADRNALECANLFERTPSVHRKGGTLLSAAYPRYFRALNEERSIAATDAHTDPRTSEFSQAYLGPNRIGAMLDAPVFVRGTMVGAVCNEHVGDARDWQPWEELVAGSIADFVALALEASERNVVEQKLQEHQQHLEALVSARTAALSIANERLEREIVERTRAEERVRHSRDNLKTLFEISPVVLVLSRMSDQHVVLANRQAFELFGTSRSQITGLATEDYYVDRGVRAELIARVQREGHVESYQAELKTHRGREFPALVSAQQLSYDDEPALLVSVVDISEQKATEERLRQLATTDSLTGCYNRRHFLDLGAQEFERSSRYLHPISVAMLDADHFKRVNDTYGHDVGDRVLQTMAEACRHSLRKTDILGRFGGEEFAIVFVETSVTEAQSVVTRLLSVVANSAVQVNDTRVATTMSAGLVERHPDESFEATLKRADAAVYQAKGAGRNCVAVR